MKKDKRIVAEQLKNWYFIDSVLFNDYAENVIYNDGLLNEFRLSKESLLNTLSEMYDYIGYNTKMGVPDNEDQLKRAAVRDAVKTKHIAAQMMKSESIKNSTKNRVIREFAEHPSKAYLSKFADNLIDRKFRKLCLDNILLGQPVIECSNKNKVNDFKFQILEEGYYLLRNSLVNIAKVVNEALTDYGIVRILGFAIPDPRVGMQIQKDFNQKNVECERIEDKKLKAVKLLEIKIETLKRIMNAIQGAAKQNNDQNSKLKFLKDMERARQRLIQYQAALAKATQKYRMSVTTNQQKQQVVKQTTTATA